MTCLTEEQLASSSNGELVAYMDAILQSPYWGRMGNDILGLNVSAVYDTTAVKALDVESQRKLLYKVFGCLLQIQYVDMSSSAQFFRLPDHDGSEADQIHWAAREQWVTVSSRIAYEYFMHLTYMLREGTDFPKSKSVQKTYRKWLKKPGNPYTYFAISAARAYGYDRQRRTPEVHASTRLARKVLIGSAMTTDSDQFVLVNILKNQWQFLIAIADNRKPNGWAAPGGLAGDAEWYEIFEGSDSEQISDAIDKLYEAYDV